MEFDFERFRNAGWAPRTETIPAPEDFKQYFGEDVKPEFVVRQLSANELFLCERAEALAASAQREKLSSKLKSDGVPDPVQGLLQNAYDMAGIQRNDDPFTVRSKHMLKHGVVKPEGFGIQDAVLIEKHFAGLFMQLVASIKTLTEGGAVLPGKSPDSTKPP